MNTILSLIFLVSIFITISNGSNNGDYFEYYNESSFSFSGSENPPRCTITATYSTGGGGWSSNDQCQYERKQWESQQEFDLQYYEVEKVCSLLTRLPDDAKPSIDYEKRKNVPSSLIWTSFCSSSWSYCPRFQCEKNDTNPFWDAEFEKSFTYHEVTTLSWSSIPIRTSCYVCLCAPFNAARVPLSWSDDSVWAWDCTNDDITINGTDIEYGQRWNINPVTWGAEYYDALVGECKKPTPSPTPLPTVSPVPTTFEPTQDPTAPICTSSGFDIDYDIDDYYWSTPDDCVDTIQFCLCEDTGPYCKSGWDNIMNDDKLYPGFLANCGANLGSSNYLSECWQPSSANRLFSWYDYEADPFRCSPSNLYMCPRCGCTSTPFDLTASATESKTNTSFNTTTWYGFQNASVADPADYEYTFRCVECSCILGVTDYDELVAYVPTYINNPPFYDGLIYCDAYDSTNNDEQIDCIYSPQKCYSNDGVYDPFAGRISCSQQRTTMSEFQDYCSYEQTTISSSPDEICVEHSTEDAPTGNWGCEQTYRCELYGDEPGCYSASYDYKLFEYDCLNDKWVSDTYNAKIIKSCCNDANNCNNRTIEDYGEEDCPSSSYLKEYESYDKKCEYSQRNIYSLTDDKNFVRAAFCGDSLDYDDYADDPESLCDLLKVYWQYYTFCSCNMDRIEIAAISEAGLKDGDFLINQIKIGFWNSWRGTANNLEAMYDYWSCSNYAKDSETSTFFDCDFDAEPDSINNKDSSRNTFSSSILVNIFGVIGISLLYNKHTNIVLIMSCLFMMQMFVTHGYIDNTLEKWSRTGGGSYGDCEFGTALSTSNDRVCRQTTETDVQYQDEDLTWDVLNDACPQLRYTGCYTENEQISMKDLIWPNYDNACDDCPRCPCNNETDTIRHYVDERYNINSFDNMINQSCYECTCSYWRDAEDWAWSCSERFSQSEPYSVNDTYFCVPTQAPTAAPTPDFGLSCMVGGDFDNLIPTASSSRYGYSGVSHCGWTNQSVARYDDGEPAVCVFDEVDGKLTTEWFTSDNFEPICLAIAGDDTGCYYADFDFSVKAFDCALDEWVSDTYSMEATMFCCNDGDYCNNQTMIMASRVESDERMFDYISGEYMNETMTATCKKSGKLQEYLKIMATCQYNDYGVDAEFNRAKRCRGGKTNERPTCDTLNDIWKWETKCDCDLYQFFKNNVNDTYDDYLDEVFDDMFEDTAEELAKWNKTLGCDYGWKARWNAYGVAQCDGVSLPFNLSIIAALVVIISFVSN